MGGLLLLLPVIVGILPSGKVLERIASPDGRNIAEIRVSDFAAATDVDHSSVVLRSRLNPFGGSAVFGYVNNGATVNISWVDAKNLRVDCGDTCDRLEVEGLQYGWNGISIHYSPDLVRGTHWEENR
jgi:hypothetical protein